jgi:hypothetical protein
LAAFVSTFATHCTSRSESPCTRNWRVAGHAHSVPPLAEERVDDLERMADDLGELNGNGA